MRLTRRVEQSEYFSLMSDLCLCSVWMHSHSKLKLRFEAQQSRDFRRSGNRKIRVCGQLASVLSRHRCQSLPDSVTLSLNIRFEG
mgnify:CR=1 FL=1